MTTEEMRQARVAEESISDLIGSMRLVAWSCGYALAVHGTLKRDLDLVAVPWIVEADTANHLAASLAATAEAAWGFAHPRAGDPIQKPHGRLCWAWDIVWGNLYIDLSVMPRLAV